jgi:DNA-binding NtrC family response regulator
MKYKALVVEDNTELALGLCAALRQVGYAARHAPDAEDAVNRCLREDSYHLAICDNQLPGESGLSLLQRLRDNCPATFTVLLTAYGTPNVVALAFKHGAVEFIPKPVKPREFMQICERIREEVPLFLPNRLLLEPRDWIEFEGMLSCEDVMLLAFNAVRAAAPLRHAVLLIGEAGVGKASLARALHKCSPSSQGPFVMMRTAAYPVRHLQRVLFGRDREDRDHPPGPGGGSSGSCAVEQAEGGTLYVDDVTALDSFTQVQLLNLLENGRYCRVGSTAERSGNVRVVVSSSRDLDSLAADAEFNRELLHRLRGCAVQIPPLRDRRRDIPLIANRVLERLVAREESKPSRLSGEAERMLCSYTWPGNIRELESAIQTSVFGVRSATLQAYHLPAVVRGATHWPGVLHIPVGTKLADIEREAILQTLRMSNGNKSQTAEALGISRRSLYDKLSHYQHATGPIGQASSQPESPSHSPLDALDLSDESDDLPN